MSAESSRNRLVRMSQLARFETVLALRQRRAERRLQERRLELDMLEATLRDQQVLVAKLESELNALLVLHKNTVFSYGSQLIEHAERRRWLRFDLEKEQYYLGVSESDCLQARQRLSVVRKLCWRVSERRRWVDLEQSRLRCTHTQCLNTLQDEQAGNSGQSIFENRMTS